MAGYLGNIPVPQATMTHDTFVATSGQTTFATSGYTPNFLQVFLNGVKLINGDDFTATNGSDVVLTTGATAGDTVEVLSYSTFEVNSQTFTGTTTLTGDLQATTATFSGAVTGTSATLSGGVYLGGTGAANLLDDYEEGTWTPSLNLDGTTTYAILANKYVKVGKQVTVWFAFIGNTSTAQSGIGLYILGLPFSVASTGSSTTYENGAVPILTERMYGASAPSAPHTFYAGAFAGTSQLNMFEGNYNGSLSNSSYFTTLTRSSVPLGANLYIVGQLTYTTT